MASLTDAELNAMTQDERANALGMTTEQLSGRSLLIEFSPDEEERFLYPWAPDVDFNKRTEIDTDEMASTEVNTKIRDLMAEGYGTIVIKNPRGKHSIGVGILSKLNLIFEGSLGYFGVGLIDGPNVRISGRVGWSCGENMMSGTILIEKNAGSTFGAALRGGDLVCRGSVGSRTGIDMKGGTIIVGGDRWPTRILRNGMALRMKENGLSGPENDLDAWEAELGMAVARSAMLEGHLEEGIAYTGAGTGLISEIVTVAEVFRDLVDGGQALAKQLV